MYIFAVIILEWQVQSTKTLLSHPAPCFVLSKQTKIYDRTFIPNTKTDTESIHRLKLQGVLHYNTADRLCGNVLVLKAYSIALFAQKLC